MNVTGLDRNTSDKFYTSDTTVKLCSDYIQQYITISEQDLIIEPSAGNGAFIAAIKQLSKNAIFFDIEPEHREIAKQDYINYLPSISSQKIHVMGNPPFGRQSSMVIKFIKKSCAFANTISFILPKSFKKESMRNAFSPYFHLLFETDLPENSFTIGGNHHNVPCIFQIWEKRDYSREIQVKSCPTGFEFVSKSSSPDISFRRVGVYAGKIDTSIEDKSEQSHYFIRFTNGKSVADNITALTNIQFQHDNTVGPRSISKPELIKEFNAVL